MLLLRRILLLLLLAPLLFGDASALAASAAFSPTGDQVMLTGRSLPPGHLLELNLKNHETRKIDTQTHEPLVAIAAGRDGYFCVSAKSLFKIPAENVAAKKICDAPDDVELEDVACNPKDGSLIVLGRIFEPYEFPAYDLPAGSHSLQRIVCRRVRTLEGVAFDRDGHLFFADHGDLWSGKIDRSGLPDGLPPAAVALRFGPVAALETQNTTPGSTGADEIAVAGRTVYAQMHRMGGSGWGEMISVRWQPPKSDDLSAVLPAEVTNCIEMSRAALDHFRSYGENARESFLCASADGRQVFFATRPESDAGADTKKPAIQFWLGDDQGNVHQLTGLKVDPAEK